MPFSDDDAERWLKRWFGKYDLIDSSEQKNAFTMRVEKEIGCYLSKNSRVIDLPYKAFGSPFQIAVWEELRRIPYGEVRSYKDIAISLGREKACRAVGAANRSNPLPLVIPCHRVIASDLTLGGYSGKKGLGIKKYLLEMEGSQRIG